jgi:predicted secreted protein
MREAVMTRRVTLRIVGPVVLLAAVVAVGLLAGCGGSSGTSAAARTIEVTPVAQTGTTVDAAVGDKVVVSLEANATTGYEWQFTAGDTFVIENTRYVPSPAPSNMVGTGGTQTVTLKVTKAGSSDLTGAYRQPWVSPSPDAQPDFQMTIVSK